MQKTRRLPIWSVLVLLSLLSASCAGGLLHDRPAGSEAKGNAAIKLVSASSTLSAGSSLRVTGTGPLQQTLSVTFADASTSTSFLVDGLIIGVWELYVEVLENEIPLYDGSGTIEIFAGQESAMDIDLIPASTRAAIPQSSAVGGTYLLAQVDLWSATEGSTIRYTADGSLPDVSSTPYVQPLIITQNTIVRALTFADGIRESEAFSSTYLVSTPDVYVPDDTEYARHWHYDMIDMPAAWGIMEAAEYQAQFSEGVVAVIDSGYVPHPDLSANLYVDNADSSLGFDFVDASSGDDGVPGIDPDPTDPGDDPVDPSWHGTHVAGTIAAITGNGTGISGVGNNKIKVMPVRALAENGGTTYDIAQAVLYAAGEPNDSGAVPAVTIDVINMSLGALISTDFFIAPAIQKAVDKSITVVAAAGNENGPVLYPAVDPNAIAVSAVDILGDKASYSNFGSEIDFAAPGGNLLQNENGDGYPDGVLSTIDAGGYDEYQGTSMATPHVAGLAGLLYSINSNLNHSTVYQILAATGTDIGAAGKDIYFGHGLINAARAVAYVVEGFTPQVEVTVQSADILPLLDTSALMKPQRAEDIDLVLSREHAADALLVMLKQGPALKSLGFESSDTAEAVLSSTYSIDVEGANPDIKIVRLRPGQSVRDIIKKLAHDDAVLSVQPNYIYKPL